METTVRGLLNQHCGVAGGRLPNLLDILKLIVLCAAVKYYRRPVLRCMLYIT
jgi:hypothetical protein